MKFSEIIKADSQLIQVPFQDRIINIKPYISIEDKYDFATIVMQQSMEDNGLYNPIKIEKYFNLYLAYMYTDIEFSEEDRADDSAIYDILETTGLFDLLYQTIPSEEIDILKNFVEELEAKLTNINTSALGAVLGVINSLPVNAATAAEMLKDFDPTKLQEAMNFARAIGADV